MRSPDQDGAAFAQGAGCCCAGLQVSGTPSPSFIGRQQRRGQYFAGAAVAAGVPSYLRAGAAAPRSAIARRGAGRQQHGERVPAERGRGDVAHNRQCLTGIQTTSSGAFRIFQPIQALGGAGMAGVRKSVANLPDVFKSDRRRRAGGRQSTRRQEENAARRLSGSCWRCSPSSPRSSAPAAASD